MTTGIEDVLLKLGQAVAQQLAKRWLTNRTAGRRRGKDLSQLVRTRFPLRRQQREVFDALRRIEDSAAERLSPAIARAAHGLSENERVAALDAVSDALEEADLTDVALFGVDLDPTALVAQVHRQVPVDRAGLSERAGALYDAALERACIVLVHLVRELPEFDAATAVETLGRLTAILGRLDEVLDRLPETSLDAPAGADRDEQFLRRYLEAVKRWYDHLEVVGLTTHHYEPKATLTVAYLSLSVTSEEGRLTPLDVERMGLDWLHGGRCSEPATENLRVETALGASKRTLIRGEAGAGKSTLLCRLAVNAARGRFTDQLAEWNGCVPFLVKLRDFPDTPPPRGDDLLSQPSSPPCGPAPPEWVHRQLDSGRALLLVDGVDELTKHRRDGVRTWLRGMLDRYPALNLDRKKQLPRDRLALYAAALEMLLEHRDASRNVPASTDVQITAGEKQTLLRELAWWLAENGRTQLNREQARKDRAPAARYVQRAR